MNFVLLPFYVKGDAYDFPMEYDVVNNYGSLNLKRLQDGNVFDHIHKVEDLANLFHGTSLPHFIIKLFPISLGGYARTWLNKLPLRSITSYQDCPFVLMKKCQFRNAIVVHIEIVILSNTKHEA